MKSATDEVADFGLGVIGAVLSLHSGLLAETAQSCYCVCVSKRLSPKFHLHGEEKECLWGNAGPVWFHLADFLIDLPKCYQLFAWFISFVMPRLSFPYNRQGNDRLGFFFTGHFC